MTQMISYTYSILRYVHDTTTGEFINVGVAIYAPEIRYTSAICRSTFSRLAKAFPGINAGHFKSLMRHIQSRFEQMGEQMASQLPLDRTDTIEDLARRVLPMDDSSLQWSPMGSGRSADPTVTLDQLFERMVTRYEEKTAPLHRVDDDVWRSFKRTLETRQLLQYFEPRKIAVLDDEIEFQHTWQNGILHCLEPVSFDLSSSDNIKDKAHRWLGRLTSVAKSAEKFQIYFMVGQPQDERLTAAFDNALGILGKSAVPTIIFREQQVEQMSELLAKEVSEHR